MWDLDHTVSALSKEQIKMVSSTGLQLALLFSLYIPHAVPDAPPQNVMTVLSSTEIQVSWEEIPAINQSGSITFFEVRYNPLETFNGSLSTNTTITTMLGITLNSLEENVDYNISVRAYSVIGPGPYSEGVVKRTDEDRKYQLQS